MADFDNRLNVSWWALRIGLGVGPIVTGIDKYFNKLADWEMYLSPLATKVVPLSPVTFMHVIGIVEIVAGLIVLSRWTKLGSYIVMFWLLGIAVNLLTTGMFYDLAMRDAEIAIGAFVLSQLTIVRAERVAVGHGPKEILVNELLEQFCKRSINLNGGFKCENLLLFWCFLDCARSPLLRMSRPTRMFR